MSDPGYTFKYTVNRWGDIRPVQIWHDSVKMYQHWLDIGFCGDYEPCIKLLKKWLRDAKREQAKKEVKTS